ncbi:hypothetical protein [Microbacterium oxydans]|uniref:hypothetical protein n=1 Tax=Microbacterium oxydans TaxID=82380 RepID=UPI0024ACDF89|nr:hypothetical protein [Microbacterium oxydans]
MSTAADEELRALRARAYGPTADIEDDPAALRRLQQLEARRQPRPAAEDVVPPAPAVEPIDSESLRAAEPVIRTRRSRRQPEDAEGDTLGVLDTSVDDAEAAPPTAEPAERLAAWFSVRTTRILWVVAIVAAAAMSAAVTFALVKVTPVASSAGAPQIATLDATSDVAIPAGWMGVGPSSAVFDFYGLVIVESSGGYYNGSVGSDCLTVARADQVPDKDDFDSSNGWTYDGPMYTGCAVGAFPATVEVPFDTNTPKELTERFPDATALQFVYEAERVGVFLDSE